MRFELAFAALAPRLEIIARWKEKDFFQSECLIDDQVRAQLLKGNVIPRGQKSSLYDQELSSMDVAGRYDQEDARGLIRLNGLRLRAHKLILRKKGEDRFLG